MEYANTSVQPIIEMVEKIKSKKGLSTECLSKQIGRKPAYLSSVMFAKNGMITQERFNGVMKALETYISKEYTDVLEIMQHNKSETYFVGCAESSGFFFIGNYYEFVRELPRLNNWIKGNIENVNKHAKADVNFFEDKLNKLHKKKYKKTAFDIRDGYTLKEIEEKTVKSLSNAIKRLEETEKNLKEFKTLQEREVFNVRERAIYKDGTIIILQGSINSFFNIWWKGEEKNGND